MSHKHQPDGRLRVATALLIAFSVSLIQSIETLLILLSLVICAATVSIIRKFISTTELLNRAVIVNFFVFLVWLTIPIDWETRSIDMAGIALALQISIRINIVIVAVSLLLTRMSCVDFSRSIVALGLPQSLGTLLVLSVRSISLLEKTRTRLDQAMRARAYRPDFTLRTIRVSAQMVVWLLIHALVRSERIRLGLLARGYTTLRWPTRRHSHWHALPLSEWMLLIGASTAIFLALIAPEIWM
jgi:cobalt/nickel transport system permease protein